MPAVQPALLRRQAALLAGHFDDPPAYLRSLHHLLDFYADRAHRPGKSGMPAPILAAYKVRPPILRMILHELLPLALEAPPAALALCDALWLEQNLEFRLLAAMLLGRLPVTPSEPILSRLQAWLTPDLEFYVIEALMQHGLERMRQERPKLVLKLAADWLESKQPLDQQLGLRALLPLAADPQFDNLPVFFRLLRPLSLQVPQGLRPDLLDLLAALARRSPQETAYFMRQALDNDKASDTAWLIRQLLNEFPPESQQLLKQAL